MENSKSINKDSYNLLTINIPDEISSKKRNIRDNKVLKDVKYYVTNGNSKKMNDSIKRYNYLKNPIYNSVEHIYDNHKIKTNKPFLPIIKPSLFNIFANNQNKDTSFLNPITRLKTENNDVNSNRKRFISNGNKIDFNALWNNSNNSINNDFKYRFFMPNYKKFNISTLKGSLNLNI